MEYLHQAMSAVRQKVHGNELQLHVHHGSHGFEKETTRLPCNQDERQQRGVNKHRDLLSTDDLINCITAPKVIDLLTDQMLNKSGISKTGNLPLESLGVELCSEHKPPVPLCTNSDQDNGHEPSNEQEIEKHLPCKRKCNGKEKRKWNNLLG